ncbi:S24 family peptidase [Methylorubrum salsuginis]|uniref:Phage repressor protein C, contains Cro/C1-type HTH and peptisase s24 domains n=1 Tax=Methylorubrum salsuginis TaxID=414703 RepID=A0A1I4FMV5_9HYPH|nr:S24 family peptidase [Methylorubrum salsuginis]SFL17881.1 Phage repressor protein C, contains Cro/C1-type HTH and peptisase s24 domains [Methylorubrum salsuginis]
MSALRHFRSKAGLSQAALASAAGTSQPQIKRLETGERTLTKDWAERLAPHIGIDARTLLFPPADLANEGGDDSTPPPPGRSQMPDIASNVIVPPEAEHVDTGAFKGPRNVPVYGTGSGGDGKGDFTLNGQIIDHAPRPPGITNRKDVYVVYLVGDSVSPKYEDGDPLYIDPHRRPQPRDYVFVEKRGEVEGEPGPALVKRLVKRGGGKLYLEQHIDPKELPPIDEADVVRVHRVIPWPELIGI